MNASFASEPVECDVDLGKPYSTATPLIVARNDGIANIGGSARQKCEAERDHCLEKVGQTAAAIETCISACEDKALAPVCR